GRFDLGIKKVAPGTRAANYRCSLPGLAGFVSFASPRAAYHLAQNGQWREGFALPGGERGSRTLGTVKYTRFPIVPLRPLGHLSKHWMKRRKETKKNTRSAEREGFEPPVPVKVHLISNQAQSTRLCHLSNID